MIPLITRADIAQYRQISKTPHDDKLNEQILDAQMLDAAPLLGEKLFNKIMNDPDSYEALLDGGTYTYQETTYTNYGLKMVLAYFAYARYMMFSSVLDTPFSVVEKLNGNESRPADISTKKSIYQINRDSAFTIWNNVQNYLIRTNNQDFPNNCKQTNNNRGMRFTKIG